MRNRHEGRNHRVVRTTSEPEIVEVRYISSTYGMPPSDPLAETTDRDAG